MLKTFPREYKGLFYHRGKKGKDRGKREETACPQPILRLFWAPTRGAPTVLIPALALRVFVYFDQAVFAFGFLPGWRSAGAFLPLHTITPVGHLSIAASVSSEGS